MLRFFSSGLIVQNLPGASLFIYKVENGWTFFIVHNQNKRQGKHGNCHTNMKSIFAVNASQKVYFQVHVLNPGLGWEKF